MFIKRARLGIICYAPHTGQEGPGTASAPEPKTLAEAQTRISDLQGQLATANETAQAATSRAETAEAEQRRIQGIADASAKAATQEKEKREKAEADLATAQQRITTVTGERDKVQADLSREQGYASQLENLCQVKGIDPKAAVASGGANTPENAPGKKTLAEYHKAINDAKTPAEQNKAVKDLDDAIQAGLVG